MLCVVVQKYFDLHLNVRKWFLKCFSSHFEKLTISLCPVQRKKFKETQILFKWHFSPHECFVCVKKLLMSESWPNSSQNVPLWNLYRCKSSTLKFSRCLKGLKMSRWFFLHFYIVQPYFLLCFFRTSAQIKKITDSFWLIS